MIAPARARAHSPRRLNQRRAFTLLETLAALLLMAIVLPVTMRAISMALSVAGEAAQRQQAVALARSKLAELRLNSAWQEAAPQGDFTQTPSGEPVQLQAGQLDQAAASFHWSAQVEDWLDPSLRVLRVRVEYLHRGSPRHVELTTLVAAEAQEGSSL
ncbi:MAG TPA: prepilin-type N-terminal cleavage/methylation domain-containing protein [Phycisphaeraceae bacterium]